MSSFLIKKQHFPLSSIRAESDGSESARFRVIMIRLDRRQLKETATYHPALQEADGVIVHHSL